MPMIQLIKFIETAILGKELPMKFSYLSLLQSVDFLNSCGYPLFSIFKIESGVPLGTCPDFNSPVILVLLLKFQDQVEGVAFHLGFGKSYQRNLLYFLVRTGLLVAKPSLLILRLLESQPALFKLISLGINDNDIRFLFQIQAGFFSIFAHPLLFYLLYGNSFILPSIIQQLYSNGLFLALYDFSNIFIIATNRLPPSFQKQTPFQMQYYLILPPFGLFGVNQTWPTPLSNNNNIIQLMHVVCGDDQWNILKHGPLYNIFINYWDIIGKHLGCGIRKSLSFFKNNKNSCQEMLTVFVLYNIPIQQYKISMQVFTNQYLPTFSFPNHQRTLNQVLIQEIVPFSKLICLSTSPLEIIQSSFLHNHHPIPSTVRTPYSSSQTYDSILILTLSSLGKRSESTALVSFLFNAKFYCEVV